MTDRLPSMPFFVGDYLGSVSVRLMTLAERGAYTHLLFMNWQEGRLEKNPKQLAKLLDCSLEEFEQIWEGIKDKFKEDSKGRIYNKKVEDVKNQCLTIKISAQKREAKVEKQLKQNAGKAQANLQAKLQAKINLQSIPYQSIPIQTNSLLRILWILRSLKKKKGPLRDPKKKKKNRRSTAPLRHLTVTDALSQTALTNSGGSTREKSASRPHERRGRSADRGRNSQEPSSRPSRRRWARGISRATMANSTSPTQQRG